MHFTIHFLGKELSCCWVRQDIFFRWIINLLSSWSVFSIIHHWSWWFSWVGGNLSTLDSLDEHPVPVSLFLGSLWWVSDFSPVVSQSPLSEVGRPNLSIGTLMSNSIQIHISCIVLIYGQLTWGWKLGQTSCAGALSLFQLLTWHWRLQ